MINILTLFQAFQQFDETVFYNDQPYAIKPPFLGKLKNFSSKYLIII